MLRLATLLTVATVLLLALATGARADVVDNNPATASRGPGDKWVFIRGDDGTILTRHWTGDGWSGYEAVGSGATSGPAAIYYMGRLQVFVRGSNNALWQTWLQPNGSWHSWVDLGGGLTSAPAVAERRGSVAYLDLVVRGGDNQFYHRSFIPDGRGWTAFSPIGGFLTSAPSVNSQAPELLNIWGRAGDGSVAQKSWTSTAWTDWLTLGGIIDGAPTSISRAENVINVYVRGSGDAVYQNSWGPSGWSGWFLLDAASMNSAPAAGSDSANREWLFARHGSDQLMYKEWTTASGWSTWNDLGRVALPPAPSPDPPASAPLPVGEVNVKTGVACTPANGRLRVSLAVKKPKGKNKPRVTKIVFFTKGKGRRIRTDRKAPFEVHLKINRPAGSTGRVYARVYYKRTARGKTYRKVVSRRYKVCR